MSVLGRQPGRELARARRLHPAVGIDDDGAEVRVAHLARGRGVRLEAGRGARGGAGTAALGCACEVETAGAAIGAAGEQAARSASAAIESGAREAMDRR